MLRPLSVLRELRSSPVFPPRKHPVNPLLVGLGIVVIVGFGGIWLAKLIPQLEYLRFNLGTRLSAFVLSGPPLVLGVSLFVVYCHLRDRPTMAFEFPYLLRLPGWWVWTATNDTLALTRRDGLVMLFQRPGATLHTVLEELDPDRELAASEPDDGRLELDLPDDLPGVGLLQRFGPTSYVLALVADDEALGDLREYLEHTRLRMPDEPVQRWREVSTPGLAPARVVQSA